MTQETLTLEQLKHRLDLLIKVNIGVADKPLSYFDTLGDLTHRIKQLKDKL